MICRNTKCRSEIEEDSAFCRFCGKPQNIKKRSRTRANGHGTAYQLPNGKWRAERTLGYEWDDSFNPPKRHRIVATRSDFAKKSDALAYIPLLGTELDKRERSSPAPKPKTDTLTLKELYDKWEPTCRASEKTVRGYRVAFKIFADEWDTPITDITIDDLQECFDSYEPKKGLDGKRSKQVAKTALNLVFKYAIPRDYIRNDRNLAQFLIVGAGESTRKQGLSEEELELVRTAIGKIRYADYVYAACYLGFRPSAFLSLTTANYNRTEKAFIGGIKTEAGINRTVTVSPKIQPIIDQLTCKESGYVFCDENGNQFAMKKYRAAFYSVLDQVKIDNPVSEYGLHRLSPHSCRHTFASLMKKVDAPAKDKLKLMGHTTEEMLAYYQDVSLTDMRSVTDRI